MQDKSVKILLFLIALGLFLNAAAMFYNSLVTPAYAADNRIYLEEGRIEVSLSGPVPIEIRDFPSYDELKVSIDDVVNVKQQ